MYFNCIPDNTGTRNKLALVQYSFDGPVIEVKIKPHGNAKGDVPFLRTSESTHKRIRNIAVSEKPKSAIFTLTKEVGGEIDVDSPSMLPRNRQQISNVRRSHTTHDKNVQLCSNASFLKERIVHICEGFKAAPSPQSVH